MPAMRMDRGCAIGQVFFQSAESGKSVDRRQFERGR
jgi:hypothetical protein